jgi:hypothetical protein
LSFFDDADEPQPPPRTRRPSGTGRRPPTDHDSIMVRRAVAAVAILIVLILIVLGIHSCQVSARDRSLKDYNHNVASLIQQSDETGAKLFNLLSSPNVASDATGLQNQINEVRVQADSQLGRARNLDVPDEVKGAHQNFLLVMLMRRDGIANIAPKIQAALGTSTNQDAIKQIAAETGRFYASDVLYKDYVTTAIAAALHAAGIPVGPNGETIEAGQFLPDLGWLSPDFIASKLGQATATPTGQPAPGLHGHSLDSVSVGGTTLQTGSPNTIPASPPPTFSVKFTNTGQNAERNVVVKVSIQGTSISAQTTIPSTASGQQVTADVPLPTSPPKGTYTVNVTVQGVPGEKNLANNSMSFPVTFQ